MAGPDTITVLSALFAEEDEICIRVLSDRDKSRFHGKKYSTTLRDFPGLIPELESQNSKNRGVFFVVNSGGHTDREINRINAQFVECDDLSLEEQQNQIDNFPLPPSMVIRTRKSLHTYWFIENGEVSRFRDIQQLLVNHFHGDRACVNESRVMRLPGFYHCKQEPLMVECISFHPERRYTQDQLTAELTEQHDLPEPLFSEPDAAPDQEESPEPELLVNNCRFMQHCRSDAETLSEFEWYAMISNLCGLKGGVEKIHELSSPYPGYSKQETDNKIRHYMESGTQPILCKTIMEKSEFRCPAYENGTCEAASPFSCAGMDHRNIIHLIASRKSVPESEWMSRKMKSLYRETRYADQMSYYRFRDLVSASGICLKDYETQLFLKDITENRKRFPGIEFADFKIPYVYLVTMNTICYYPPDKETGVTVSHAPVFISGRMIDIDTGQEWLELTYPRNGKWKKLTIPRADAMNRNALLKYAGNGLPVSSSGVTAFIRWLEEFEAGNINRIPSSETLNRFGWFGENQFFPHASEQEIVFADSGMSAYLKAMTPKGDLTLWTSAALKLRETDIGRLILAASFASVLLEPLQLRILILHNWGNSRSGKTAAMKISASVWGDPQKLVGNFDTTQVGLERKASLLHSLPMCIDELQSLNERKTPLSQLIYMLGNGTGRTRGTKNGSLQETSSWRNIILTSGEQPILTDSSMDGVASRVLELYGSPLNNSTDAQLLHQVSENNYGIAGTEFLRKIFDCIRKDADFLKRGYESFLNVLKKPSEELEENLDPHLGSIALLCFADYLSGVFFFGCSNKDRESSVSLGFRILNMKKEQQRTDTVDAAWEYVKGWVVEHQDTFTEDGKQVSGRFTGNHVYILRTVLERILTEGGYSYEKCRRGFAERGYIISHPGRGGKPEASCSRMIGKTNARVFELDMDAAPQTESGDCSS